MIFFKKKTRLTADVRINLLLRVLKRRDEVNRRHFERSCES